MKIKFYVVRFLRGQTYLVYNFHEHLFLLPCLYAASHPYKHAVLEVYKGFLPIFAALEHCSLHVDAQVYHHRKLLHMGKIIAAVLLLGESIRDCPKAKLVCVQIGPAHLSPEPMDTATCWLEGLQVLLFSYVLALFSLGTKVRNCMWFGCKLGMGSVARAILQWSLLLPLFAAGGW